MNLEGLTEKRRGNRSLWYENEKGEVVAKKCTNLECFETKPIEDFNKKSSGVGGREGICKFCKSSRNRNYREINKDKITEYRVNNRSYFEEYHRKYYENNREKMRSYFAEYIRKYYKNNREKFAEYARNYRINNLDKCIERDRKYYENNKEKVAERHAKWSRNNPEKRRLKEARRRARKNGLPDTLTTKQYEKTLQYFGNACALTGQILNLEKEHAIPIAVGHGGTIFENMYPMVNGLNQSKNNRNIFEWFEANRQRFELSQERFDRLIEWLASANAMSVEEYRDYVYWCHDNPRTVDENIETNEGGTAS